MSDEKKKNIGNIIDGILFVSPHETAGLIKAGAVLVDLRDDILKNGRNFDTDNIINLPYSELESKYTDLPKDRLIILADYVGLKSKEAVRFLRSKGYSRTASLVGGILDWEADGMPLLKNTDEELVGGCACQLRPRKSKKGT